MSSGVSKSILPKFGKLALSITPFRLGSLLLSSVHTSELSQHSTLHWGSERSSSFVEQAPLHSPKATMWIGMSTSCLLGPFFFEQRGVAVTVDGRRHTRMLTHQFYPTLMDFTVNNMDLTYKTSPFDPSSGDTGLVVPARPHLPSRSWITSKLGELGENDRRSTSTPLACSQFRPHST